MALVLGVDPGCTGAAVLVNDSTREVVAILDLPLVREGKAAWIDGRIMGDWLASLKIDRAIVERVHTYAGNRQTGTGKDQAAMMPSIGMLMMIAGGVLSLLSALDIPTSRTTSSAWKGRAGLHKRPKEASAALAANTLRWPAGALKRVKDHNRAEAGLIALHGLPRAAPAPKTGLRRSKAVDQAAAENLPPGAIFAASDPVEKINTPPCRPCRNCKDTAPRDRSSATPTCTNCGVADNNAKNWPIPPAAAQLQAALAEPEPRPLPPARAQLEEAIAALPAAIRLPRMAVRVRGRRKAPA